MRATYIRMHEDYELILAAKERPEAFAALYEKYAEKLYQFLYYRCGKNTEIAEDLLSEVFIRALKRLPHFEWQGHAYSAYLYRIARSLLIEQYKQPLTEDIESIIVKDPKSSQLVRQTELQLLWKYVETLPEGTQEMLRLRYLDDLSYDEIADIVDKKSGAVRTAISRAIDTLQHHYE